MKMIFLTVFLLAAMLARSADDGFQVVQVLTNDYGVFGLRVSFTNTAAYQRAQASAEAQIKEWESNTNVVLKPREMRPWEVNYVNIYEVIQIFPRATNIIFRTLYVVYKGIEHFMTGYKLMDCIYNTNRMYGVDLLNDNNESMSLVFFRGGIMTNLDTNLKAQCRVPGIPSRPGSLVTKLEVLDRGETALYVRFNLGNNTQDILKFDGSLWQPLAGQLYEQYKASGFPVPNEKPPDWK